MAPQKDVVMDPCPLVLPEFDRAHIGLSDHQYHYLRSIEVKDTITYNAIRNVAA